MLEVLFIYSIKKGKNDIFSLAAHLSFLHLVTDFPHSTKGGAKGHVLVRGVWAGLSEHPERPFSLNRSLVLPSKAVYGVCPAFVYCASYFGVIRWLISLVADNTGMDKRGRVVEWVEKTSFDRLNKLFEITAAERHHQTLLTARNLLAFVREPQVYVINILPRKLPKKVVPGEHFVFKDLPFYKEVRKVDAQARRARLTEREERRQERTLRKAPGDKRSVPSPPAGAPAGKKKKVPTKGKAIKPPTSTKGVVIKLLAPTKGIVISSPTPIGLPSVSSGSGRIAGLNGSGPSMPVAERMTLLVEEATSVYQSGSSSPDADVAGAFCAETLPPMAPPMEETGAERQGLPPCESSSLALVPVKGPATRRFRPTHDLKSGISGWL